MRRIPKKVWAVSTQAHYPAFEKMLRGLADRLGPGLLIAGSPRGKGTDRLEIVRGPGYRKGSLRERAESWLRFSAFSARKIAETKFRFLLVVTNPPIMPHIGWALSKVFGFRVGILVWDLYPKSLVDVGLLSNDHPIVRAWSFGNQFVYRDAVFVATLSDEMAEAVVQDGCEHSKVVVTPNWTDVEAIQPVEPQASAFRAEQGVLDRFVVMYSGNVGAGHALHGLVDTAERLKGDDRFCFFVIGRGLGLDELRQDVEEKELTSFRFLDYLPDEEFFDAIASADLAVVSQRPGAEAMSMPSKTYTAMAAGDAILALTKEDSSLGRLVSDQQIGVVCDPLNGEQIAEVLTRLADNPKQVEEMGKRARLIAEKRYSVDAAVDMFERLFRKGLEAGQ